jgi:hypothetical protein
MLNVNKKGWANRGYLTDRGLIYQLSALHSELENKAGAKIAVSTFICTVLRRGLDAWYDDEPAVSTGQFTAKRR